MPPPAKVLALALCGIVWGQEIPAQSVLDRTPNLAGGWVGAPGVVHFNFLHRFSSSSSPERKVTSTPTFLLAAGLPYRTLLGIHYATNSELSPRYPNEWEFFGRVAPLEQDSGSPVGASVQVGYNLAAKGLDGEAAVSRQQGQIRVLAALRVLDDPGTGGGADVAVASGLVLHLSRHLGLSADLATLTKRASGEKVAWGVGLNLAIPRTPHTLSLHATNVNNATLQSASRGTGRTRYGFEFTIPLTLSRYFGGGGAAGPGPADTARVAQKTVKAAIEDFSFRPARLEIAVGTTVTWSNDGQVSHTVTAEDGSFDSGDIEPAGRRSLTFSRVGTFPFHCTPHPFMRGVIVVR